MTEEIKTNLKECPHCNKMVSGYAPAFKRHLNKCSNPVAPAVNVPVPVKKESKGIATYKADLSIVKDPNILRMLEQAYAVQKSMLEAPEAVTADMTEDVNYKLRKRYAPETIERFDDKGRPLHTHTAYFGDAREVKLDIAKGYLPVINESGEFVVNMGGDILYVRPLQITESIVRAAQNESRARLSLVTEKARSQSTVRGIDAPQTRNGEIKEEEMAVTGTLTLKPGEI